jgi:hypothetical protein
MKTNQQQQQTPTSIQQIPEKLSVHLFETLIYD